MRIAFKFDPSSKGNWRASENRAIQAFEQGTKKAKKGCEVICSPRIEDPSQYDMVGIFGVRNKDLICACQEASVPFVYFDKAYNRDKKWWKLSVCAHHPTKYIGMLGNPDDRRKAQRWDYKPWRKLSTKSHILIAGSSLKYHNLYELPHPTKYWTMIVKELKLLTNRRILYRPKKSWQDATPIAGTEFSKADSIIDDLRGAHCMITHGSNACFEALQEGIPAIVLGNGVTRPISSSVINEYHIETPIEAQDAGKDMVLNNLAYFQWSVEELSTGIFWKTVDACLRIRGF